MSRLDLALVLPFVLGACILSPESHSTAEAGRVVDLVFQGIGDPDTQDQITVEYEQQRGGFVAVGTTPMPGFGSWFLHVQVPAAAFWKPPCGFANFRVRDQNGTQLVGTDQACEDAAIPDPNDTCLTNRILVQLPQTHVGDIIVVGQSDADLYQCVTDLQGSLSITGDAVAAGATTFVPGVVVTMPRLETISGSLTIDGNRSEVISLPRLESVGGDLGVTVHRFLALVNNQPKGMATRIDGRRLASVGGDVSLQLSSAASWGNTLTFWLDTDALTSVGGDVTIHQNVFPSNIQGLRNLKAIPGDLLYDTGTSDLNEADNASTPDVVEGVLNSLETVGGNVQVLLAPNANFVLLHLAHVGGDLTLQGSNNNSSVKYHVLPLLADVGGDMALHHLRMAQCQASNGTYWPELASVGGTLLIGTSCEFKESFGATGGSHLSMAALDLDSTSTGRIPFHPDVDIDGGDATFQDNTLLCQCRIDAFTAALAAGGWAGSATSSGNGTAATCSPCPAPASCP